MVFEIPIEVLDNIVLSLARGDALRFALTCRAAYASAVPAILRDVSLGSGTSPTKTNEQLRSFCDYLSADLLQRASYIRSLTLTASIAPFLGMKDTRSKLNDGSAGTRIARVLHHAPNLRELNVYGAEDLFSRASPQFTAAVISLTTLSVVCFEDYVGKHALNALSEMRSQPTVIRLTSFDMPTCNSIPGRDHHPLRNFMHSLVRLTLINNHGLFQNNELGAAFSQLEHLILGGVQDIVDLPSMARAFPSVRKLEVYTRCTENIAGSDLWVNLDTVILDRSIPLARPVQRLELIGVEWLEEQLGLAVEMLVRLKPVVLICPDLSYEIIDLLAGRADGSGNPFRLVHAVCEYKNAGA